MKLFVGSLPFSTTEDELHQLFSAHGKVASAKVILDRETGRSRGFGFVEMPVDTEAQAAIAAMNGANVGGRNITVNEARPMENRGGGGGGGGYGGGGRGGGYGGGGGGGGRGGGDWGGGRGDRGDRGDRGGRW